MIVYISNAELSTREKDILEMICRGMTTKQIADAFFGSENNIMSHRKTLMKKIGAHREADIIKFGIKAGIIKSK
jgi:DNA-binding CsgD family transcriptional regulator